MASGSWTFGTSNGYIQGRVEWSSTSNGSTANSSQVRVRASFRRTNSGYLSYGTINTGTQVDSQTYWDNNRSVSISTGWVYTLDRTFTVPHNSDGSKNCYIRVCGSANFSLGSFDTSSTVSLDKIPRYTSVSTFEVSEVGQTWAKINWATADNINWARVYLNNNSQWTDNPGSVSGKSGSFTYTGMAESGAGVPALEESSLRPGTTYNLKIEVRRADSNLWTTSSNISFTTTPIATITNTSIDFNIGSNLTLTFKDYQNNKSFLKLFVQKTDGQYEEVASVDETLQVASYTWSLYSISSTLYSKVTTRNSANIRIECGTTINGVVISNTIDGVMKVINSNPSFSNYDYGNTVTSISNVLGSTAYMPTNYGSMQARITSANKAVAKNQATILRYEATVTNSQNAIVATGQVAYSSTAQVNLTFGSFNTTGTYRINIYAIDSRGNKSSTITKTFYIIPYELPQVTLNFSRMNDYEEETVLDFSAIYSKLTVGTTIKNNTFTVKYRYAEAGKSYGNYTTIPVGLGSSMDTNNMKTTYSANPFLDLNDTSNKQWNFEFVVSDKIGSVTISRTIEQGIPVMFIGQNEQVSIGRLPDIKQDKLLQVASDILVRTQSGENLGVLERIDRKIILSENEPTNQFENDIWIQILE